MSNYSDLEDQSEDGSIHFSDDDKLENNDSDEDDNEVRVSFDETLQGCLRRKNIEMESFVDAFLDSVMNNDIGQPSKYL